MERDPGNVEVGSRTVREGICRPTFCLREKKLQKTFTA